MEEYPMSQIVLADALLHAERLFARKEAAVNRWGADTTRMTYGELGARCRRLMGVLRQRGIKRKDRITVLSTITIAISKPISPPLRWGR